LLELQEAMEAWLDATPLMLLGAAALKQTSGSLPSGPLTDGLETWSAADARLQKLLVRASDVSVRRKVAAMRDNVTLAAGEGLKIQEKVNGAQNDYGEAMTRIGAVLRGL
jgi:hypothetical protein